MIAKDNDGDFSSFITRLLWDKKVVFKASIIDKIIHVVYDTQT